MGNTLYPRWQTVCHGGVQLAKQRLLRLGIILYGFRLTFQQIADVGASGIIIDALTLTTTFLLACWLGKKVFGIDSQTAMLIGAGSSICGAAAVMATEPVLKADSSKVAVAVSTVVVFGTGDLRLPMAVSAERTLPVAAVQPETFGIYAGSTIHEVAQVVAAGHAIGPDAENAAVIAKMIRVMMLAPFLLLLSGYISRGGAGKAEKSAITIPWFAVLFIAVAGLNSFNLLPATLVRHLITADTDAGDGDGGAGLDHPHQRRAPCRDETDSVGHAAVRLAAGRRRRDKPAGATLALIIPFSGPLRRAAAFIIQSARHQCHNVTDNTGE